MDLLGDLGAADQLTSTRAENKVLKDKVKELEGRVQILTVEKATLEAEVEIYRNENSGNSTAPLSAASNGSITTRTTPGNPDSTHADDHFVQSGDGVYAQTSEVLLDKLHGISNPSCCALSSDDMVLGTGGADRHVTLCQWGKALGDDDGSSAVDDAVNTAIRIDCGAPIIAVGFCQKPRSPFCAVGCMDGSVHIVRYQQTGGSLQAIKIDTGDTKIKHSKYVREATWSSTENLLATASADGTVLVHRLEWDGLLLDDETTAFRLKRIESLTLAGPVESICFHRGFLLCYARGTPYLSMFDTNNEFAHTKKNLNNQGAGNAAFNDHVSFAVMDMQPHGDYLALATDTSRNIVLEFSTFRQVRNLYGHKNDGFSQPKVAWSLNGKYLYGNTQDETTICVWDISTSEIVTRLEGHVQPIRDLCSSSLSNTLVSTSFDKKTNIWFAPAE